MTDPPSRPTSRPKNEPPTRPAFRDGLIDPQTGKRLDPTDVRLSVHPARFNDPERAKKPAEPEPEPDEETETE